MKEIKIEMNHHNYNHKHKDNAKPEKKPTIWLECDILVSVENKNNKINIYINGSKLS